jgi:NitT/TauT family transport system substrate-binding protein
MSAIIRTLLAAAVLAVMPLAACFGADTIRVAVQKTGTFAWELAVIRAHGLDKKANLTIEATELASPEAGKIALRAGNADVMVSDWLWVSRERTLGARLAFYPYSSALGAVMVPTSSPIRSLTDLRGRKLAVAGGPIDKSWLLLRAVLQQQGIDPQAQARVVYGAPALLAGQFKQGATDALLNYWNFCARLEGEGFRRIADIEDLLPKFGVQGPLSMIGYAFDQSWAARNRDALDRFLKAAAKAKEILLRSDAEWERIAPLTGAADAAVLKVYRDRYRQGIPRRTIEAEEADARVLYRVLARLGGSQLVGQGTELAAGTFYRPRGAE